MRISILVLLFLFSLPLNIFAGDGTFLEKASVTKSYISLGDIVKFSETNETINALASQRIGSAPKPGQTIILDSHTILRQLASQHLLPSDIRWEGASEVSITREGIKITPEKISQIIDHFLQTNLADIPDSEIRFNPRSLPLPFALPAGEVTWTVIPSKSNIISSTRFSIIFKVDNRVSKNLSVKGDIEALIPIAIASKNIKLHEPFSSSNVTMEVRNVADVKNPIFKPQLLAGKQATRSLKAGNVIKTSNLESIPLVFRGQPVKVLLRSGGLQLTTKGIARADGGLNDTIRVQNANSNKILYCKVAAPGLVEVQL